MLSTFPYFAPGALAALTFALPQIHSHPSTALNLNQKDLNSESDSISKTAKVCFQKDGCQEGKEGGSFLGQRPKAGEPPYRIWEGNVFKGNSISVKFIFDPPAKPNLR